MVLRTLTAKGNDLHLPMTISLIPWISTVGFQDPNRNITTNLSLNIIAGYHTKLDGLELGGVLNMKGVEARGAHNCRGRQYRRWGCRWFSDRRWTQRCGQKRGGFPSLGWAQCHRRRPERFPSRRRCQHRRQKRRGFPSLDWFQR